MAGRVIKASYTTAVLIGLAVVGLWWLGRRSLRQKRELAVGMSEAAAAAERDAAQAAAEADAIKRAAEPLPGA